jgi:hypothetical protein
MQWRRRGLILAPPTKAEGPWRTHCQMPILTPLFGERWRLYFSGRDSANHSHGFMAELNLNQGADLVNIHTTPILAPGERGAFDADGAMPSSLLTIGDEIWLYYLGWTVRHDVPFQTGVGLAVSKDGGATFERAAPGPVLGQGLQERFSTLGPLVLREEGQFRMYYSSVQSWHDWQGQLEPRYSLRTAVSPDGMIWRTRPGLMLEFADEDEGGLTRPSILRRGDLLHMWYSRRGWKGYRSDPAQTYHFGYATSLDGEVWRRHDDRVEFTNPPEPDDWDSMMQAYPAVIQIGQEVLCFYSGNGFGQSGIGYATLEGGVGALEK